MTARAAWLAAVCLLLLAGPAWSASGSIRFCDGLPEPDALQQHQVLEFAAAARQVLTDAGEAPLVLVSRTGTDLHRFGIRYSHAGFALRHDGAWEVRQLYYACSESRPRLFDQGLAGFLVSGDDRGSGYLSLVLMPLEAAQSLAAAALDNRTALSLLAADYSANAYAFSTRYQNCNQWAIELMALAWGGLQARSGGRAAAQDWLRGEGGYMPEGVALGAHWPLFVAPFVPLIHLDDHPEDDRFALRLRTTLPTDLERFVRQRWPGARHIEMCHDDHQVVIRRDRWEPLPEPCRAEAGDEVRPLAAL